MGVRVGTGVEVAVGLAVGVFVGTTTALVEINALMLCKMPWACFVWELIR